MEKEKGAGGGGGRGEGGARPSAGEERGVGLLGREQRLVRSGSKRGSA